MNNIMIEKRVGLYAGIDPTGPSLHIGHMLPFMILGWAYVWGMPVSFVVCVPSVPYQTGSTLKLELTSGIARRFHEQNWRPKWTNDGTRRDARLSAQGQYRKHAYATEEVGAEH